MNLKKELMALGLPDTNPDELQAYLKNQKNFYLVTTKGDRIKKYELLTQIIKSKGKLIDVARKLDVSNILTLKQVIAQDAMLSELMKQENIELILNAKDVLEASLDLENEKIRLDAAKFILERLDKEEFGNQPQIAQQINVNGQVDLKQIFGIPEESNEQHS